MEINPYEILGLQPGASKQTIKKRYIELIKKYHPDTNSDTAALEMAKMVNLAYEMLKDIEDTEKEQSSKEEKSRKSHRNTEGNTKTKDSTNAQGNRRSNTKAEIMDLVDEITFYDGTYIIGIKNKKYGLLSKGGQVLIDFIYENIKIEKGRFIVLTQYGRDSKARIINYTQTLIDYHMKKKIARSYTKGFGAIYFFKFYNNCIVVLDNDIKTKDIYDFDLNIILSNVKFEEDIAYSGNQSFLTRWAMDQYAFDNNVYYKLRNGKYSDEQGRLYSRGELEIYEVNAIYINYKGMYNVEREEIKKYRGFLNKFYVENYEANPITWLNVTRNGKQGIYIKKPGTTYKKVFPCTYDHISIINEEAYILEQDKNCGIISTKGFWLIEPKYCYIEFEMYKNYMYILCYPRGMGYTTIYDENYNCIYEGEGYVHVRNGEFRISPQQSGCAIKYKAIDFFNSPRELIDNKNLSFFKRILLNEEIEINSKKIRKTKGGYTFYLDEAGDSIKFEKIYKFYDDIAIVKNQGGYGIINNEGTVLIETKYDYIGSFINGCALGYKNEDKILIIKTDKKLIEVMGDHYMGSYGNLHIILKGGKYGVVNEVGKEILEAKYDLISPMKKIENGQGYLKVRYNGKEGVISTSGVKIVDIAKDEVEYRDKDLFILTNNETKTMKRASIEYDFKELYKVEDIYILENNNRYITLDANLNPLTEEIIALSSSEYVSKLFYGIIKEKIQNSKLISLMNKISKEVGGN